MKNTYDVLTGFWHKRIFRAVGSELTMTADEAKYLVTGGNLRLKPAPVAATVAADPVAA
jgi:hypothetical protein